MGLSPAAAVLLVCGLCACGEAQSGPTAAELEAHVRFLASDDLGGRRTGTSGAEAAARYLALELERSGTRPAFEEGYLQEVPIERTEYLAQPVLAAFDREGEPVGPLFYGIDFDRFSGVPPATGLSVRAVRSAGDLAGPPRPDVALWLDGSARERRAWLEEAGTPRAEGWGLVIVPGSSRAGRAPGGDLPRGDLGLARAPEPAALIAARGELREHLRAGEIARVRLAVEVRRERIPAWNVVAILPGKGERAGEAIVISAHYDHLGTAEGPTGADPSEPSEGEAGGSAGAGEGPPPAEDRIYNGADDDASGCAAVLAIAAGLAAGPPPERTVVFLFAAAEEIGLLGTRWYLERPAVPLERTVCNLNFEMIGRPDAAIGGAGKLWLTGFERSNLGPELRGLGLAIEGDPRPEQRFFQRSDNYPFALRGIVAQTLSSYDLHGDYHRPSDEAELLDFAHMEAAVRSALEAARALADGRIDPRWEPGGAPGR